MSSINSAPRDGHEGVPETRSPSVFPFPGNPAETPVGFHEHLLKMCTAAGRDPSYRLGQKSPAWDAYIIFSLDRELRQFEHKLQNIQSTDDECEALRQTYFSKAERRFQIECNMMMLEKRRRVPRSEAIQDYLGWLQPEMGSQTSAGKTGDLSEFNHWVLWHTQEPHQVLTRAALHWATRGNSGGWIERLFKGKIRDEENIGEIKEFSADFSEGWFSVACDMIPVLWFCVPVGVLGSGVVSQGVGIVLFIFFVLTAAMFARFWYPEWQHGIVITVGYGALLSSIIFR